MLCFGANSHYTLFLDLIFLQSLFWNEWAGVVTERIQEAHRNKSAPIMMLFPGYYPLDFPPSL